MGNNGCCSVKPAEKSSCSTEKKGSCGDKKPCCWGTLFKGAVIGGIVMFAWVSISWMALSWHKSTINTFASDAAVAKVLDANALTSGVYMLPECPKDKEAKEAAATPAKGKKAAAATAVTKPFAFVSVFKDGVDPKNMNKQMVKQFILCLFSALLLTCLLKKSCCSGCPVATSFKVGLLVALVSHVPNMIWFQFPLNYTLVGMADNIISFTLAGFFISKLLMGKKGSCGTTAPAEKSGCCG